MLMMVGLKHTCYKEKISVIANKEIGLELWAENTKYMVMSRDQNAGQNHNIKMGNTVCPTRYRTRHIFNNFTTNEDIVTKFEADYRHIPLHFSHNERTPVQISLQYLR